MTNTARAGQQPAAIKVLDSYDATAQVGLRVIVCGAAVERVDGTCEATIELPKLKELRATAAMMRCLMPERLQGAEIKAMRKIMGLTLAELAKRLDERTAPETVLRWEADAQPMGGYADKVLRLLICETLRHDAHGVEYSAAMIANMKPIDPWKADPGHQVAPIVLQLIRPKQPSGEIIQTYHGKIAA